MPKNWEEHFDHALPQAKAFWANKIPGTQFIEISNREAADFVIQWASQYQGTKLGYWNPSSVNELGKPYIAITLGYMDDESVDWRDRKFNLVDPEFYLPKMLLLVVMRDQNVLPSFFGISITCM